MPVTRHTSDHPSRSTRALLAALLATALPASAAAAPLIGGLGGPAGYGTGNLPANDDGSSDVLDIRAAFPDGLRFFGTTYTSLYVNNNGNVSFGSPLGTFTPRAFPIASQPMIAPWWGDVDTRGGGVPRRNGVYWSIRPGQFVATWHNVGYFSVHDDLQNDFQLILTAATTGVGDFDVELRYNRCEWTTGDASGGSRGLGGTPAQAGFDAGNLRDYVALPGSLTMNVLRLCTTSNVGIPGVWRFEIRGGEVMCPGRGDACETGRPGVCGPGTLVCVSADASRCEANASASEEVCNGLDDDCDAAIDERLGDLSCGIGPCAVTVPSCVAARPQRCTPRPPSMEVCNLVDDDCNGRADDLPDLQCGVGACTAWAAACTAGNPGVCTPGTPTPELCNGLDDDCNGAVDDTLIDCEPPDAGPPDAGRTDAGVADASIVAPRDAGRCPRARCDPWELDGRAGPIGRCSCRVTSERGMPRSAVALVLVLGAILAIRRRR
jgi:MYXO-CTERM domain-containing protein